MKPTNSIRAHLLCAAALTMICTASTSAQLKSFGALDAFGYPQSYTDFDDVTLVHGTDVNDPLLLAADEVPFLPDPRGELSVASGNFFEETFYWAGEADMATTAGDALLVMAIEGIWLNEVVVDGEQAVMGRLRIRIDLANPGHYVVTHPYGVDEFDVSAAEVGDKAINFTIDSIDTMGPGENFSTPLDRSATRIGPSLLKWDEDAPDGYMGDPGIPHRVTGSPFRTNVFRVEGPGVGGRNTDMIETDLFSIVGKMADAPPVSAFKDLGFGLPGTQGIGPVLEGDGDLAPKTPYSLSVTGALPRARGVLFVSLSADNTAFLGGVLVPEIGFGVGVHRAIGMDDRGMLLAPGITPPMLSGAKAFFQLFLQDPGGPEGYSATNALEASFQAPDSAFDLPR